MYRRRNRTVALTLSLSLLAVSSAFAQVGDRVSPFGRVSFLVGLEGSKQPQDLGINANMGIRLGVNAAIPLATTAGLGLQVGAAVNLSDAAVHVLDQVEGTSRRTQAYVTAGLFQRANRVTWALVGDLLRENYYDTFTLGQLRGEAGVRVSGVDELGLMANYGLGAQPARVTDVSLRVSPIAQALGFWRRQWESGATTTLWGGLASEHHNQVLVFPDASVDRHIVVYGARLAVPLNARLSITGAASLMTPTATGTVDAFMGLTWRPGRGVRHSARERIAPVLDVANNTEMPVDLAIP